MLITRAKDLARGLRHTARVLTENPSDAVQIARVLRDKGPAIVTGLGAISKSDKSERLSIGSLLERNARERPGASAVLFEEQRITHLQLNERANRLAHTLAAAGIVKGDPVAILLENRPEILYAVAGVVKLGAVAAVINTNQRKHVLEHSLSLCKAKYFVVGEELWDAFDEIRGDVPGAIAERVLFVPDAGARACPKDATDATRCLAEAKSSNPAATAEVTLGDPCFYIYTSGTTGLPKASIMSHFRWFKAAAAFGTIALALQPHETLYVPLPLYHNNALTVGWSSVATAGATLAIRRRFSATKFWDDVRRFDAQAFCYIGELCRYLMNQPNKPDDAQNPVYKIVGNGLRPDIWKAFKERFDIDQVYEFYAASEGNIAFVNVFNRDCSVGFCPAPYALVEYDIDEDEPISGPEGHLVRVQPGGVGLLIGKVSQKYAFDGYTDKAASEKKLLRNVFEPGDCWFNSGDLLRDQGLRHAQFVDRVGDTFRWKGENVSTNEVAEVCNQFDGVSETTVYGVHIAGTDGRAGMAAVVLDRSLDEIDLSAYARHLKNELPGYAVPVFLRFKSELEITGTFKQKKSMLRDEGFDPSKVEEALFCLPAKTPDYVQVTADVFASIVAGDTRF